MRLTLRTLIAYLDDELQPDQAKEIGQKLTESSYATALVDRIKEVMRRRRLSAPELFGKGAGLDPNLVAEYLDSELTPAEVVDVEKICLDSDMHLAEVAACHQILTLVLGDPVEVRQETRSRMYGLGPVATSDVVRANDFLEALPGRESRSIPMIASSVSPAHNGSPDHALPDYLQPQTSWRRTGMLVLVLLIGIGWVSLMMNDPTMTSQLRPGARPENESTTSEKTALATGDLPGANAVKPPVTPDLSKDPQIAQLDPAISNKPRDVRVVAPKELPEIEPEFAPAKPVKPLSTPPQPAEAVNKPAVEPDEAPLAKVMTAQKLARVSKDGILLRFDSEAHDFVVCPRGAELKPGDRLACPEPFRADLMVGDDLCLVALNGGTAVRTLGPDEHAALGFDVEQGALLFEARGLRSAEDNADEVKPQKPSLPITLMLYGRRTRLELATDDAVCGLEVRRHEPTHFETDLEAPGFTASLHVARGSVRFINVDGKAATIEGPGFLPITSDAAANMKNSEIGRASQLVLPDWLEPDPKRAAAKLKRPYNIPFEKEFDADQPLLLSMPAVVSNPRPAISELAVKCLALTDSHEPLVKALARGDHREARLVAITGLRQWLPLDPRNRVLLKAELAKHFLPSDADAVYRLLWGFDQSDAKIPATSRTLVGWLESEHLAIRELAFFHVQRLTGLKHEYSPINPPGQRRAAVERWYSHLEKKGGALVQE
ncbi:MAG: hypothetical protein IAG10_17510 [Planctomycetaceae bacterium]|nr:hypothetical protein [Planctomycetaceae bacterium]